MGQTRIIIVLFGLFYGWCVECYSQTPAWSEIVDAHSAINENAVKANGYSRTTSVNQAGEIIASSRMLVDYKSGSALLENRRLTGSPYFVNTVYSINPRYCFKLTSKGDAEWGLFKYVLSDSPELNLAKVGLGADYARPQNMKENVAVFPSFRAIGGTDISLPHLSKFKRISNASTKLLNSSEIELTFDRTISWGYDPSGEASLEGKKTTCRMVLNSASPYLPVSFSENYENQIKIISSFEYEKLGQYEGRIVERVKEDWQDKSSELVITQDLVVGIPPKREFLLSSYGFNEPSEFRDEGFSPFLIFASVGGLFFLLGGMFLLFRRK